MRLVSSALCLHFLVSATPSSSAPFPSWSPLPSLPDAEGFAGSFAGTSGGVLLTAGGTNFPDKRPWEGGTKLWYDTVFALERSDGTWRKVGKLPEPNGYGVSISTDEGLICIGGGNATENFRGVFRLRYREGAIETTKLPPLPAPCAFMAGARLGTTIYIAGGIDTPSATRASSAFWALDLHSPDQGWQSLPIWPGAERILPCLGAADGCVFLFSGARLQPGPDGKPVREWLRDAYRFCPTKGWKKIADLPRVAVAAPSPAPLWEGFQLLVIGGDDGTLVNFEPKDKHPGFPRDILAYDVNRNQWTTAGATLPFSLVTTPAVTWKDHIVIPGGEARPGKRSPEVWWLPVKK